MLDFLLPIRVDLSEIIVLRLLLGRVIGSLDSLTMLQVLVQSQGPWLKQRGAVWLKMVLIKSARTTALPLFVDVPHELLVNKVLLAT
jgi:hypothetical protein